MKYHDSLEHKQQGIAIVRLSMKQKIEKSNDIGFAMDQFLEKVRNGPDFVCCDVIGCCSDIRC